LIKNKEEGCRIMGLDDPTVKMSKSASSLENYILLAEDPKIAEKKIKKATTDSLSLVQMDPERPGISNLLTIYSLITNTPIEELEAKYQNQGYAQFKNDLGEKVQEFLESHQEKAKKISDQEIKVILQKGSEKASLLAQEKMREVKQKMGLI
jgi:tryptophanyl-tRNA synthetase